MRSISTLIFIFLIISLSSKAQISNGGTPYSFKGKYISNKVLTVTMPEINADSLIAADVINNQKGSGPWIFGYNHYTSINPTNSGQWETLWNGDKIWRVAIECPKALSINLTFDKFVLPKGASLYIYNENKDYVLGAFTSANNQADQQLGVDIVPGSKTIVEYYQPVEVTTDAELSIYRVTHGYKDLFGWAKAFGSSGSCNYNVNCTPIGTGWEKQRDAVAIIVVGGSGACTGAMVDDVPHSNTPYFLTANHCGTTGVATWVFRWNWQASGCPNPTTAPSTAQSTTGSTLRATNTSSDFTLLQLNSTPPASYNVFYAGWDRSGTAPTSGMCIHHPSGDIKKISRSTTTFTSVGGWGAPANSHWNVVWTLDSGITEPGSSGSPIFDQNQRVVGQLHGGPSACGVPAGSRNDDYGKFSMSWTGNGSTSAAARLMDWLDPANTGANTTDGHYYGSVPSVDSLDLKVDSISEPIGNYCNDSTYLPRIRISNQGTNTVYSFSIKYRMDAGTWSNQNWTGTLAPAAFVYVNLPTINTTSGNHTFTVCSSSPNTHADQDNSNDTLKNSFLVRKGGPVTFNILTDDYPNETSFAIYNPSTGDTLLIIRRGDLTNNRTLYSYSLCMDQKCYRFKIYDSGNDGICCGFGNGYFILSNGTDTLIPNASFTNNYTKDFCNYQLPEMSIIASDLSICAGESINFTAIEGYNTSRSWSITGPSTSISDTNSAISPVFINPGSYQIVLIGYNSFGSDTANLNITVNNNPTATYTVVNDNTSTNGSITVASSTGAAPITHSWSNGMTGSPINNLSYGVYYDTITDANGCKTIVSVNVLNSVGINNLNSDESFFVYPNPFVNEIIITCNNANIIKNISLSNSLGEKIDVTKEIMDIHKIKINTQSLSKGVYYLIITDEQKSFTTKLIKS